VRLYSPQIVRHAALFRVIKRFVGMTGVFPNYLAAAVRNADGGQELTMMRWGKCRQ